MAEKSDLLRSLRIERDADAEADGETGRARTNWVLIGGVAAATLILGGAVGWFVRPQPAPVEAVEESATTAVTASSGGAVNAGGLVASGYVVARRMATVAAEVTGRVLEVRVEEGQVVHRGDVLAVLEPTMARTQLASAQARAAAADADLAEAQRQLARTEALSRQGFASPAALTAAQSRAQLAEAERNASHADARTAAAQLDRYQIRAPFSGVIVDKAAQAGEIISPMSAGGGFTRTGICTIVDMQSLEVEVDVAEAYISRVTPGQHVNAVLDAYPDVTFPAHVIAIIPAASRDRATFRVRVGFDDLDPRVLPEMAIKVTFLDQQQQQQH
ncbi:MAG TPA: efflux RND transporter periplasmic adaptor subunit [Caulobacterales bacterium]|nr:efflux RND transporter periplasmic adaptor subunit [Caulobacterales bacterium]